MATKKASNYVGSNKNSKSLKNRITKYIYVKQDICCEKSVDKKIIIDNILNLYTDIATKQAEKAEYLSYIENDLLGFIGYKIDLIKQKNTEGLKLLKDLTNKTKILNKNTIMAVLNDVPLYILLSLLGYAYYRIKRAEAITLKLNAKLNPMP